MTRPSFLPQDIRGIIPPMATPFARDGDIDETAFREQLRFLAAAGVHGVAVGGSTGEGHTLTAEETGRLITVAIEELGGRIPVIAGIIVDSTRQAIERAEVLSDLDVAALQITPVHYLFRPDDEHMLQHFRAVAEVVPVPVIIYNVVPWSYLSPRLLVRIMNEVPGVIGVKQSAGDLKLLADLMITAPEGSRILSAVDALMYPSFALGAHGAIAAILTAAPGACVRLWDAVQAGDHATARGLHEAMLVLWNAMVGDNLPACVKFALQEQGVEGGQPRAPMPAASAAQQREIAKALGALAG